MIRSIAIAILLAAEASASSVRGSRRRLSADSYILCRMLNVDTMYEDGSEDEVPHCAHIKDGRETDALFAMENLPAEILANPLLEEGRLFVNITAADVFTRDDIAVSSYSTYTVIDEIPSHLRHLQAVNSDSLGRKTLAVVRISTRDAEPSITTRQLQDMFDPNGINLKTQYEKCSGGKLEWVLANTGVIDVRVSGTVASYGTRGAPMVAEAEEILRNQYGVASVGDLADRVMFCAAKGPGTWVGSAGMRHWRIQLHDSWCLSLTGAMHELGHTIGLGHSNENGQRYGDTTGNMARSFQSYTSPQRCFDPRSNHILQWYKDRELSYNIDSDGSPRLVELAAFVDYTKTNRDQYVLITLNNKVHIQYNRQKTFNSGTGERGDAVTINEENETGNNLIGGLILVGETFTYRGFSRPVVIEVCRFDDSIDHNDLDKVFVSVGVGGSACGQLGNSVPASITAPSPNEAEEAQERETSFPTSSGNGDSVPAAKPVPPPTQRPTPSPTNRPTPSPTMSPTPFPTLPVTSRPTISPTPQPTVPVTPRPTVPITAQPTAIPSDLPSDIPSDIPSDMPSAGVEEVAEKDDTEIGNSGWGIWVVYQLLLDALN